jgi:hypothetical protein
MTDEGVRHSRAQTASHPDVVREGCPDSSQHPCFAEYVPKSTKGAAYCQRFRSSAAHRRWLAVLFTRRLLHLSTATVSIPIAAQGDGVRLTADLESVFSWRS